MIASIPFILTLSLLAEFLNVKVYEASFYSNYQASLTSAELPRLVCHLTSIIIQEKFPHPYPDASLV